MSVFNLKPSPEDKSVTLKVSLLSESSFYTEQNFDLVSETVNSKGESTTINFSGRNLTNYIDFISNKVLVIDDISDQFTGVTSSLSGDKVIGLSTFSIQNSSNSLLSVTVSDTEIESNTGEDLLISYLNHDLSTGEPVDYAYTISPIEITPTVVGSSSTTILPSVVYAIKTTENRFKIAVSQENALLGTAVTFSGIGSTSTTHKFSSRNGSGRSVIQIDNIIQSPLSYKGVNLGVTTSVGLSTTIISLSGISSISITDFVSVNEEIMRIENINGIGSTYITVIRGQMGTVSAAHTSGDSFKLFKGDYNIKGGKIYFSSPPLESSNFDGRVFYKKTYDKNIIFDDISNQFVGVGKTFNLLSNGSNIGVTTSNVTGIPYGVLLVNTVFQSPIDQYNITSNSGISTLTFTGNTPSELPNAGKILSYSYFEGSGYQPKVSAAATVTIGAGGTISAVTLTGSGSGYLTSPEVNIISTVGSGASITAFVGTGSSVGFITGFSITNPGSGYTTSSIPTIEVDQPYGYINIPLTYLSGSGSGSNATIDLVVGAGGSMVSVDLSNIGYGYLSGDVLTVSGLGTQSGYSPFTLTIDDTYTDSFSFWTFGKLTKTILVPSVADGFRKTFELREYTTNNQIDFESTSTDTRLDIRNNFLVFVNNILQNPNNYTLFGPFITFVDTPPANSIISILIYTASNDDARTRIVEQSIKVGDTLQIQKDFSNQLQDERFVFDIPSKSQVKTPNYVFAGINSSINYFRPVFWTKQTRDVVVAGENISKSRSINSSLIRPSSPIISGVGTTSTTIYVQNVNSFEVDGILETDLQVELIENTQLRQAKATATISSGSTISTINVTDGGLGYSQSLPPSVIISNKEIIRNVIGKTWYQSDTLNTTSFNKSIYADSRLVSVGNSLSLRSSSNLLTYSDSSVGVGTTNLRAIAYGSPRWIVGGDDGFISISTSSSFSSWTRVGVSTLNYSSVPETAQAISFTSRVNDIVYSQDNNLFVGVGSDGKIFTFDPQSIYGNTFIIRNSGTNNDLNSVIVENVYDVGENQTKTQFVSVGNSATILVSATTINNVSIGNPGLVWEIGMSESVSATGISGEQLNDVIHTGITTVPFIVVGNNGLVLTFPNNRFNGGSFYKVTPTPTSEHLISVHYDPITETAVAVGSSGVILTSQKSSGFRTWNTRSSGVASTITHVTKFDPTKKYVALSGNITLISNEEKVGAAASALVSSSGIVTSIVISEGGQYYGSTPKVIIDSPTLKKERIKSCKILGDFGTVVGVATTTSGIGTTSPALIFNLNVDDTLITSGISTGDYYVLHSTNVGNGITSILQDGSVLGVTTQFLDCVFRADHVVNDSISGIVTITSNVQSISNVGSIGTGIYGNYSWGKFYDFDVRTNPFVFEPYTLNGIVGLQTAPTITRLTSIGTTYVPDEA